MKLSEETFTVFDLEWTQHNRKHYIIEIGALKYRNGEIVDRFDRLLQCPYKLTYIVKEMTGLTENILNEHGEDREKVLLEFLLFIENTIVVAHDVQNDINALKTEYHRLGLNLKTRSLCTFKLSQKSFPEIEKYNLQSVAEYIGLNYSGMHRAYDDAEVAYKILLKILNNIPEDINSFDKLKHWRGAGSLEVDYGKDRVDLDRDGKYIGYFDGASSGNPGDMGIGYALLDENRNILFEGAKYIGVGTNNEAEYVSLIALLKLALRSGVKNIEIFGDSQLVIKQLLGEWRVKAPNLQPLYNDAQKRMKKIENLSISWVRREENTIADALSKKGVEYAKSR